MAAFVSNSGYLGVAKRIIYADSVTSRVFNYMELGYGTSGATNAATLSTAIDTTVTGLSRVIVPTVASNTIDGRTVVASGTIGEDTCWFRNTWNCSVASIATGVNECGVFNSSAGGDLLAYGTFPSPIPMGTGDTLQVTWSVQVKAG